MPVAIEFAEAGAAAKINYSIPMPGAHTGRRVVQVFLDLPDGSVRPVAIQTGFEIRRAAGIGDDEEPDPVRTAEFFADRLQKAGFTVSASALAAAAQRERPQTSPEDMRMRIVLRGRAIAATREVEATEQELEEQETKLVLAEFDRFRADLARGTVNMPVKDWAGRITFAAVPSRTPPEPRFFLIERFGISSFLGDYGMGRTVKTFTLLPGESTTISLRTWQSTKESVQESSSIIDSHEQSARERFATQVQDETTDKETSSSVESWHVEAELKASWGFGSAGISGGGAGEYHSGREQFARQASEATKEHAAEASSKRELSVTSSSERTSESGSESLIERTITNVNVRRVLNFVFRELNQTYVTKLHLKGISVGFTNGRIGSWREVPLSGLHTLLTEKLERNQVDRAAQQILRVAGTVFDHEDTAVQVLEQVTINASGDGVTVRPAARDEAGNFDPPTESVYYRFRRGFLNQDGASNPVEGVLLSESEITMRTDSIVVEALLGQADALDPYAMEVQQAAADKETLANERERLIHETMRAIEDPERRAELGAMMFGTFRPREVAGDAG